MPNERIYKFRITKNMKKHTHHETNIRYGEPLMASFRRRGRRFPGTLYNDRSPEIAAMTAHLRASAYGERKNSSPANLDHTSGDAATFRARSFLNLGQEYDSQARSNFANEAFLFGIIIIVALVWPVVQSVQALLF